MRVVIDMENDGKPKYFIINATITVKVVATSVEDAISKIKEGKGEVTNWNSSKQDFEINGVVFECTSCDSMYCHMKVDNIQFPITTPELCPYSAKYNPNWEGPYSGCRI